nr:hypothetical protein [Pseudomonas coleopterorum]
MLAALLILALCSTVLVMAFGNSARALQQAQRSDELSLAARSILDEASAGQLQAGSTEGRWSGLHWRLAISTLPAGEAPVDVWRLDLRVGQGARQAEYSTLQVRSRASGANR